MDLKSIIAIVSGEADDSNAVKAAMRLGVSCAAHVTVVPAFADPAADLIYYGSALRNVPAEVLTRLAEGEQAQQKAIEEAAASIAAGEGLGVADYAVKKRELQPAVSVAAEAVLSDLVVMSAGAAKGVLSSLFGETLMSVRAPVLLVKGAPLTFSQAAIAWDGSAQAGRAVRAAMPLLRKYQQVLILTNTDDERAVGGGHGAALQRYLALHGVRNAAPRAVKGADVAASLLEGAKANNCELLVAGGYGRPRLYELVLGGATRAFVKADGLPHILLAH